eukprot:3264354-Pleurochrysis_carterae.AAC.1
MSRRVPYGELSYVESRYRIPYASLIQTSLIQAQEVQEEEEDDGSITFSSWNIPLNGPLENA